MLGDVIKMLTKENRSYVACRKTFIVLLALLAASFAIFIFVTNAQAEEVDISNATIQASLDPGSSATLVTDANGDAYAKFNVEEDGNYSIYSTNSNGTGFDTSGHIYDSSYAELAHNDDANAGKEFCICTNLQAGTYYLRVFGNNHNANASINISFEKTIHISSLCYKYSFDENSNELSEFSLGTYERDLNDSQVWAPTDSSSYELVGYVDNQIFRHAQESGALDLLKWNSGIPKSHGNFVVKVQASDLSGNAYSGTGYYYVENSDSYDLSEADAEVNLATCNGIVTLKLGTQIFLYPKAYSEWEYFPEKDYGVVGFTTRKNFEQLGRPDDVVWEDGLPSSDGEYVVKVSASNVSGNPYYGTCYAWVSLAGVNHIISGSWIVDIEPSYTTTGIKSIHCKDCGTRMKQASIPCLSGKPVGTTVVAGAAATKAQYKVISNSSVAYVKCAAVNAKTVKVPDSVVINGKSYKVVKIAGKAFSGCKKAKTLCIECKSLTKSSVKNSLKSSKISSIKVKVSSNKKLNKKYLKKYKSIFKKANSGA